MRTTSRARDAAAGKLAEAQARLANLETRSRDTEIAQARADLADLIATRDRIAKDLARNEELLRTGAASRQTVDQQRAELSPRPSRGPRRRAPSSRRCSRRPGAQYEIAAQRAMVAQARAGLAQAEWQAGPAPRRRAGRGAGVRYLCAAGRDHQRRRSGGVAAAAAEHPGAVLRPRDRACHGACRRPAGDRLRRLRAGSHRHDHLHRAAAGIHAAGDLQRDPTARSWSI